MGFSISDTIVAIATPPGRAGIGVVRLSGPDARLVAGRLITRAAPLEPRHATFTTVRLAQTASRAVDVSMRTMSTAADVIDQVVVTYFPGPRSYTGDDVVEMSVHGSPIVLESIVAGAIRVGARPANAGEFTLRAFLNGRIDLPQAEAVADLIEAATPAQARVAFDQLQGTLTRAIGEIDAALFDLIARLEASVDFPDEGYHFVEPGAAASAIDILRDRAARLLADAGRGRLLREGLQVAIVGKPNVGKSSLFNALAGAPRAIVADVPGTTRDLITDCVDVEGLRVTLVDTAGWRRPVDVIESEGVARAKGAHAVADLTIVVLDASRPRDEDDDVALAQTVGRRRLIAVNKSDLPAAWQEHDLADAVVVSARSGAGLMELRRRVAVALTGDECAERPAITNIRHIELLQRACDALDRARYAVDAEGGALPEEFVLADLQEAAAALGEITGTRASDELLAHIFSRFCVGK